MLGAIFFLLAGIMNALMDVSMFHYATSVFKNLNPRFWNQPYSSQVNKNNFMGFREDAWHYAKFVMIISLAVGGSVEAVYHIPLWFVHNKFLDLFFTTTILYTAWAAGFNLFYEKFFRRK